MLRKQKSYILSLCSGLERQKEMERVARAIDNIIEFERKKAIRSESFDADKVK